MSIYEQQEGLKSQRLQDIINGLDHELVLVDSNGLEWTPDNVVTDDDGSDYCIDGTGIWKLDSDGVRYSTRTYRFGR